MTSYVMEISKYLVYFHVALDRQKKVALIVLRNYQLKTLIITCCIRQCYSFNTPSVFVNQYISFPLLAIATSIIPAKALGTPIGTC